MEMFDDDKKPSKAFCSATRCQCVIVVILFILLLAVIGVLAGLLATKKTEYDEVAPSTTTTPKRTTTTSNPTFNIWENHRLPDYIIPDHYDLALFPDFYDGREEFTGNVTIRLNITKATQHVLVHIRALTVTRTLLMRDGNDVTIKNTFFYEKNEYWVIEANDVINEGQVEVEMSFRGSLKNGIVGLYKSVYVNSITNQTRYLSTSTFQPTDARKAFPCLDEPGFKSTYTTTLVHRPEYRALSNMPVENIVDFDAGLVATKFMKSVPMVTYLTCFIVCDFDFKEETITDGNRVIPFRVYSTPDKVNQTDYSLDVGVKVLKKFQGYYGLPYPLPKMDMIAIPDFASGAMENWGLITCRETNLLYDDTDASLSNKKRVAVVVSHELAHMWFGNLVTMKWWDDLWLNEGFASYAAYLGVDYVEPTWDMISQFGPSALQAVMPDDSKISSHPIIVPVDHPSEITELFDSISYSKGASVLRMLDSFMGTDKFLEGLQAYMAEYEYKSTVTDDLWRALEKVPGAPAIKAIMDTWTRQMGFPVVTVTTQGSKVMLTQERFLLDPEADKTQPPSDFNYKWRIPIRFQTNAMNRSNLYWMDNTELTIDTGTDLNTGWVKLNVLQEGYYRVNYPQAMWTTLAGELSKNHQVMSPSDRSGLIDDIFNLASAGMVDIQMALDLVRYMSNEEHLVPWSTVHGRLYFINDMLVTGLHFEKWQIFVREIASPLLIKNGYVDSDSDDDLKRQLRSVVINLACYHGDTDCLNTMDSMFANRLKGAHISPNIRDAVYRYGMQMSGGEAAWDYMWAEYNRAAVPQEKRRLLYAVTLTREPWLIHRLLAYSMDRNLIRDQDFFNMITYLSLNRVAHPIVFNFARANWPALVTRFDIGNRYLGLMIPGIVNNFNTESQLDEVNAFFMKYPEAGAGTRAREQALEQIQNNIAWMTANEDKIITWLNTNYPD